MAHLRGDSTVGGKPIVTLDEMNEFVEQIQGVGLSSKMNKSEEIVLSTISEINEIGKDKNENGIWQVDSYELTSHYGIFSLGVLANFSQDSSYFQLYAPLVESSKTDNNALYFRTGSDDSFRSWEKIATTNSVLQLMDKKIDETNGVATNLSITDSLKISDNVILGETNWLKNGLQIGDSDETNGPMIYSERFGSLSLKVGLGMELKVQQTSLTFNNNNVYHEGNLNINNYIEKNPKIIIPNSDISATSVSGYWACFDPAGVPSTIKGLTYIENIKYNDNYVLQKIYSADGKYVYSRTFYEGNWTNWISLVGPLTYTRSITSSNWTKATDIYEMTITHNLGSENISSVIVIDENKISMFTGFQIISSTVIKVFSATNTTGKIIINAIQ